MVFKSRLLAGFGVVLLAAQLSGCGGGGASSGSGSGGGGQAMLQWTPPSTNQNGTPVAVSGFNVYVGSSQSDLHPIASVDSHITAYVVDGLPSGSVYFAITAIGTNGMESVYSDIVTTSIN